jgi:drug/metabolite transporter (DMT)-like permease
MRNNFVANQIYALMTVYSLGNHGLQLLRRHGVPDGFPAGSSATVASRASLPSGAGFLFGSIPRGRGLFFLGKALPIAPKTSNVTNYMFLTPFLALGLDYAVTGALPGTATFVGGGVVLTGLLIFQSSRKSE